MEKISELVGYVPVLLLDEGFGGSEAARQLDKTKEQTGRMDLSSNMTGRKLSAIGVLGQTCQLSLCIYSFGWMIL